MKCPHCATELKRRERSGYTCSACKQPFALDPKTNPLGLHDRRLRDLAQKLSDNGKLHYTASQLLAAAAAKPVAAQKPANLSIGCAVILSIGALIISLSLLNMFWLSITIGGIVLATSLLLHQHLRSRPFFPKLPLQLAQFERDLLGRWQTVYAELPTGLLHANALPSETALPAAQLRGAVVCPDADLRNSLLANQVPQRFGLAMLPVAAPFTRVQQSHLAFLRINPALPIVLLHDASPAGCLLITQIRGMLELTPDHVIRDLGLHPGMVRSQQLVLGAVPDAGQLDQLHKLGTLNESAIAWLAAGKIAPLSGVPPARLLAMISAAAGEMSAQQHAQQTGFMSWPT
jgi:hypothetical protein